MTLIAAPESQSMESEVRALFEEARQRRRHRWIRTSIISAVAIFVAALLMVGFSGASGHGPPSAASPKSPTQPLALSASNGHPAFVLSATWLPSGWSASGGGYIDPVGGLRLGKTSGVSVSSLGANGATKSDPVLFTLSYFGYHNPESKSIRLTALRYGSVPQGNMSVLGQRHVVLNSQFIPGHFGRNTNTSAGWVERGVYFQVMAQGITKAQLAQFVEGLKEQAPPKNTKVPTRFSGLSQLQACASLRHAGLHCVAQFDAQPSSMPPGSVLGTDPKAGTLVPKGSYVSLVVSSSGTLSDIASVVGMPLNQAKSDLEHAGFATDATCRVGSAATPQGTVSTQTPTAGSPVEQGYMVHLFVTRDHC